MRPDLFEKARELINKIEELKRKAEEIEERIREVEEELNSLPPGWIEEKWVLNKIGRKYYYYYYRDSSKHSIYLGRTIPPEFQKLLKKKQLKQLLKELRRQKKIIEQQIQTLKRELLNYL